MQRSCSNRHFAQLVASSAIGSYDEFSVYELKYDDASGFDLGLCTGWKGGFNIYREGNVIYEKAFGSDIFETAGTGDKPADDKILSVRIQMQDTASGLRFLKSHAFGSSGIGIPVSGRCDLIPTPSQVGGAHHPPR